MRVVQKFLRLVIFSVLVAYFVYFSLHNREPATLSIPPFMTLSQVPMFFGIVGAFVFGFLVSFLYTSIDRVTKSFKIRQLQKKVEKLQSLDNPEPAVKREPFFQRHQDV